MQLQRVLMPHPVEILWEMLTLKLSQAGRNKYDKSDCCVAIYDMVDGGCRTRGVIHASVSHAHLDGIAVQFLSICMLSSLWRRPQSHSVATTRLFFRTTAFLCLTRCRAERDVSFLFTFARSGNSISIHRRFVPVIWFQLPMFSERCTTTTLVVVVA